MTSQSETHKTQNFVCLKLVISIALEENKNDDETQGRKHNPPHIMDEHVTGDHAHT